MKDAQICRKQDGRIGSRKRQQKRQGVVYNSEVLLGSEYTDGCGRNGEVE